MKGLIAKLDQEAFDYIAEHGGFIDARSGGIVIGKTHAEGGIIIIKPSEDGKTIDVVGEMEHGEYIMSPKSYSDI